MGILTWIGNWIKSSDEINLLGYSQFHFKGDEKQKTIAGGVATLFVSGSMFYIAVSKGIGMFQRVNPDISSVKEAMLYDQVGVIKVTDVSKTMLEISEGGPDSTVELTEDTRRYIIPRFVNYVLTYEPSEKDPNVIV